MQNAVTPNSVKKTKAQRDQERLLKNQEKAAWHARKVKEKADAIERLKALVHKVPAEYSTWGVIKTRAWLAVDKKAAAAIKSKAGPTAARANALVRMYEEINTASIDALNKVARNIKEDQDGAKMAQMAHHEQTRASYGAAAR